MALLLACLGLVVAASAATYLAEPQHQQSLVPAIESRARPVASPASLPRTSSTQSAAKSVADLSAEEIALLERSSRRRKVADPFSAVEPPAPAPPPQRGTPRLVSSPPAPVASAAIPTVVVPSVAAPTPPQTPPLPYRFVGKMRDGADLRVFLAKADEPRTVKAVGELLDGQYRVDALSETAVTLTFVPTNTPYAIDFTRDAR